MSNVIKTFIHRVFPSNREKAIKKNLLLTTGETMYNGWNNNRKKYGYHSYDIEEIHIQGQRQPKLRLQDFRRHVDFDNKIVIDFGCNVGAMLHHLPEIKAGYGFDYDERCVNAAKNISRILNIDKLSFAVHDFDKMTYEELKSKIPVKPDIIFLLSLGSWINSWRELYKLSLELADTIVLEINNVEEGVDQLKFFANHQIEEIIRTSNDDRTRNLGRKTFKITKVLRS